MSQVLKERCGNPELKAAAITGAEFQRRGGEQQEALRAALAQANEHLKAIDKDEDLVRVRRAAGRARLTWPPSRTCGGMLRPGERSESSRSGLQTHLSDCQEKDNALSCWKAHIERVDAWEELDTVVKREMLYALLRELRVYRGRRFCDAPKSSSYGS